MEHRLSYVAAVAAIELDNQVLDRGHGFEMLTKLRDSLRERMQDQLSSVTLFYEILKRHPELSGGELTTISEVMAKAREFIERMDDILFLPTDKQEIELLRDACVSVSQEASYLDDELRRYLVA